jgi:assimilatory nitrate reductase catalytic subunit
MSSRSTSQNRRSVETDLATPRFLQGAFPFAGRGLFDLSPLDDTINYVVPADCSAEVVYFRGGNHSDDLIYLVLAADGTPIRYFPVGPKGDFHVPLVIVEVHPSLTRLEILIAAPRGLAGTVIVDAGILEFREGQR